MRRLTVLVMALFILAAGDAAIAVVDHRHKNARMTPAAYEASWYCAHDGQRCQERQAAEIERRMASQRTGLPHQLLGFVSRRADGPRADVPSEETEGFATGVEGLPTRTAERGAQVWRRRSFASSARTGSLPATAPPTPRAWPGTPPLDLDLPPA